MKFLFLLLFSVSAQARVFDINRETMAAYFRVNYGPSTIGKKSFELADPNYANETYDAQTKEAYATEFGFVRTTRYLGIRFGIELIRPPSLSTLNASDSAGNVYYTLTSDVSVVIPKVGLEFNIKQWKESRLFLNVNFGSGNLTVNNNYYMTPYGTANLSGSPVDYTEEGKATATALDGAIGFETLLFDTTTMVFEAGYRQLKFSSITHNRTANTLQGAKAKGDPFDNADGTHRELDFTGYFVGASFRFWIL
jgi:hypothetical protein